VRVVYALRSHRDLGNIRNFIAAESGSQQMADQYTARLIDACDTLAILPERYAPYRYATGWRMMPFESYLVFFQVHGNDVRIGHVRHGARKPFRS
jgi:plasmid stabilization system protein ParE